MPAGKVESNKEKSGTAEVPHCFVYSEKRHEGFVQKRFALPQEYATYKGAFRWSPDLFFNSVTGIPVFTLSLFVVLPDKQAMVSLHFYVDAYQSKEMLLSALRSSKVPSHPPPPLRFMIGHCLET